MAKITNIMQALEQALRDRLIEDELQAFDDGPARGIGHDGFVHSDPYCAMIAPFNSVEYRYGELCERCIERKDADDED